MRRTSFALAVLLCMVLAASAAELRGHGGPVRAVAISPDGHTAVSGSFDARAIVWSLERGAAQAVLQYHDGSVNAVAALPGERFVTAGEDGRIAIWRGETKPELVLLGHEGPIAALAVAPDGTRLASAAWDGTARVWTIGGGLPRVLEGHRGNVNGVAFLADGRIATAGYDATLRIWPREGGKGTTQIVTLPTPLNSLAALPDGRIVAGGADGRLRLIGADGTIAAEAEISPTPVITVAVSADGRRIAAAGLRGAIAVLDTASFEIERTLVGPGLPVWSVDFFGNGREILTGGSDRVVRRWNVETGETIGPVVAGKPPDPLAAYAGDPGAEVFRACIACHTLQPDQGPRAGPTLHGIMGRRIASVPGYPYSRAFRGLDIVWTRETIAKLFEIGPHAYTPGTKMPEQTVNREEDRQALVRFLEKATK